jgi:hypothetical protein
MLKYEKQAITGYSRAAEKAAKWQARAGKALKVLRKLGVAMQVAGVGMSIYDLITSQVRFGSEDDFK